MGEPFMIDKPTPSYYDSKPNLLSLLILLRDFNFNIFLTIIACTSDENDYNLMV
jgi:hypothetical protein